MPSDPTSESVADGIARELADHGVTRVFGIPGVHNVALWWALERAGIDRVIVRHEQAAMYAADGFARASGRLGVCATTSGPGAANTAGATGEALTAGSPVLHITTSTALELRAEDPSIRRGSVHDLPFQAEIFTRLVKSCWVLDRADTAVANLRNAVRDAEGGWKGPVYVEVPTDVLELQTSPTRESSERLDVGPAAANLDEDAVRILSEAREPVIWAGYGAMGAEIGALADHIGAPVVTTLMARAAIDSDHPLAVNAPPHEPAVTDLVERADLVIAIGTDFDGQVTQNWRLKFSGQLLRIDVKPEQLQVNATPDIGLAMTAVDFVDAARRSLGAASAERSAAAMRRASAVRSQVQARLREDPDDYISWQVIDAIGQAVPAEIPIVADMTLSGYWSSGYLRRSRPRTFMFPMGWGTLGFALPTAIGASFGSNGPVLTFSGDAGLLYNLGELATVRERELPVITVVFNDNAYAMLAYGLDEQKKVDALTGLFCPDIATLAKSFDIASERVTHAELPRTLIEAIAAGKPKIIETTNLKRPPLSTGIRWPLRRTR